MKVLQITTHMNIGGIGNYVLSLSSALAKKGVDVIVASSGGNLEEELKRHDIPHRQLNLDTKFELGPKVFLSALKLSEIIREERVDIIHAHSRVSQAATFFASRRTRAKYVTTCHGYFKKRLRGIFDTWGDRVIAISDAVKRHLREDLGVTEGRVELIYNGVDPDRFSKQYSVEEALRIRRSIGLKDGPVIGTIGRLSGIKGQKFLIEAMAGVISEMPNAQAILVGDGDEERSLKNLARSLKVEDSVYFISSDPDTGKFLAVMDIFIFPSVKEGLGIALLEAMASGRACIASRVGGVSDIIEDGSNGVLVEAGDVGAITESALSLLSDQAARERMGGRGRALVREKFSLDLMTDKVIRLYNEVIGKAR